MVETKAIEDVVRRTLKSRFGDIKIESILIERGTDEDGDDILRVNVVFDSKKKQLDARKASSVLRYILPKMAEIGERAFPVISFISKSDFGKRKPEAA